ncbi:uncharacterized protein LOC131423925 [Marmota monax]|uniref:uncharacterized protein LOC131423925 n=1 Tax=Marmota monax TaxID=9995 RepID=UPI0026F2A8C4|nr:uncharacterized protein LOC131423925 [Marmota monax]
MSHFTRQITDLMYYSASFLVILPKIPFFLQCFSRMVFEKSSPHVFLYEGKVMLPQNETQHPTFNSFSFMLQSICCEMWTSSASNWHAYIPESWENYTEVSRVKELLLSSITKRIKSPFFFIKIGFDIYLSILWDALVLKIGYYWAHVHVCSEVYKSRDNYWSKEEVYVKWGSMSFPQLSPFLNFLGSSLDGCLSPEVNLQAASTFRLQKEEAILLIIHSHLSFSYYLPNTNLVCFPSLSLIQGDTYYPSSVKAVIN